MKIQEKDFYYGAVLAQLAEHPVFTSINKVTEKEGLYLVNDWQWLLIKYSSSEGPEWRFTFRKEDLDVVDLHVIYFVLVCGDSTICLLDDSEIATLLDSKTATSQWVSVSFPDRGQMRVNGSSGRLKHAIPHNAFPQGVLGRLADAQERFAWPPLSRHSVYSEPPNMLSSSEDRDSPISDRTQQLVIGGESVTIYFGLSTISHKWQTWTEKNLRAVERLIKHNFELDGFNVVTERYYRPTGYFSYNDGRPCAKEFAWKLVITKRR